MKILETILTIGLFLGAAPAFGKVHLGPMGLKWKKSPATAKSVMAKRFQFLTEREAEVNGYHVVDQYYAGRFGDLPASKVHLGFFQGEFYKFHITLKPITRASKLFEVAVQKMTERHGEPVKISKPRTLYSGQANIEYAYLDSKQQNLMNLYRNESSEENGRYSILDSQILTGMWWPKAEWEFSNGIKVVIKVDVVKGSKEFVTTWNFTHKAVEKNAKAPALFPEHDY